jgi:hypothetical protein
MAFSQWYAVFVSRLEFLFKRTLFRRFRSFNPEAATAGVDYSKASLRKFGFDDRVTWTTKMLSSFPDTDKTNLLCIGPRYTTELRIAKTYGFEWHGIRGFDTFSYSKKWILEICTLFHTRILNFLISFVAGHFHTVSNLMK